MQCVGSFIWHNVFRVHPYCSVNQCFTPCSPGYIPKSKNSGSYGDFIFNFLKKCPTVFQSGCIILHSHQPRTRLPISLCPCQHLSLSVLLMIAILVGAKWCLTVVLICLFLMTNHVYVCVLSCFSCVWLFVTPWAVAHQAPLSLGFSRQEYWRGLPRTPLSAGGIFSIQGSKPASLPSSYTGRQVLYH